MKTLFIILTFIVAINSAIAQVGDGYRVKSDKLNLRVMPNKDSESLGLLSNGAELFVIETSNEWYKVEFGKYVGWVNKNYLEPKKENSYKKLNLKTGDSPECDNMNWKYDYTSKSSLLISVGNGADFAVKIMNELNHDCIRAFYIRSGESICIKDIPQGRYYLKIGSGLDFRQGVEDGNCIMMFIKNASYQISNNPKDILDFIIKPKRVEVINGDEYEVQDIPRYELHLQVPQNQKGLGNNLRTNVIDVYKFNQ